MQPHRKHLKEILERHFKYTKSIKAKELLNDFEKFESYFWLVIPAASNIQDLLKATTANAAQIKALEIFLLLNFDVIKALKFLSIKMRFNFPSLIFLSDKKYCFS